jgi:hypothetical protein
MMGNQEQKLSKHFKLVTQFPPIYTGGSFIFLKDEIHALALRD